MSKNTTVPSYISLVATLLEECDRAGLVPTRDDSTRSTLPENTGYVFLRFGDKSAASLIIPKCIGGMTKLCDIHLEVSDLAGWVELKRPNGRVMGHIDANAVSDWSAIIGRLSGASKRPIKRASQGASQAPVVQEVEAFMARLKTLGSGKPVVSSPAPIAPDSELDLLEEMSAELDA